MRFYHVDNCFFVGLYSYLRQVRLSLDRVNPDEWDDMKNKFFDVESVDVIRNGINTLLCCEKSKCGKFLSNFPFLRFFTKNYLSESELQEISVLLTEFKEILLIDYPGRKDVVDFSLKVVRLCTRISGQVENKYDDKILLVEHYNQNQMFDGKTSSVESIAGTNWMYRYE